jgi:hypothetical protein
VQATNQLQVLLTEYQMLEERAVDELKVRGAVYDLPQL